jgi:hypothetical protein
MDLMDVARVPCRPICPWYVQLNGKMIMNHVEAFILTGDLLYKKLEY